MIIAGVMSGTSCDGMTAAVIRVTGPRPAIRLLSRVTLSYPPAVRLDLLRLASGEPAPASVFARTAALVATWTVRALRTAANRARVPLGRITVAGVHGHTLFHGPGERPAVSWQACDLSRVAEATGVAIAGDFRARDVAAGGSGAPLAPWAHQRLFADPHEPRVILNLGGIANVTWLPAGTRPGAVRAFDTGPGNMLLDLLASRATRGRLDRDDGGRFAARGRVQPRLLRRLLGHAFFRRRPPKSTGREEFGAALLPAFRGLGAPDALATATAFTAASVADQLARWLPAARRAPGYAGGGGPRHPARVRALRAARA
ncbi:MAG: anhydro-N-acetylmuramic acid kinase, partial [bacterium]